MIMESVIKHITEEARKRGHEVRIRDISYALLRVRFKDELIAYTVVFGAPDKDSDITDYESLESTKFLMRWFEKDLAPKEVEKKSNADIIKELTTKAKKTETTDDGSMTFEENRAGIEQQLKEILDLKKQCIDEDGKSDVKTMALLQKTEADLRVKLNDKFGAAEKSAEQYIVVQPKFSHICEHTRRECWLQTKSFAMEHWHLIEDPNYKE